MEEMKKDSPDTEKSISLIWKLMNWSADLFDLAEEEKNKVRDFEFFIESRYKWQKVCKVNSEILREI